MKVSLIIPVYNFGNRLNEKVNYLKSFVLKFPHDIEVLFVNDGSKDITNEILSSLNSPFRHIKLQKNSGKGAAIKVGVKEAIGDYIFFTDADIPYDLSVMHTAIEALRDRDIVLGSRELPESKSSCTRNMDRKLGSKIFSKIANIVLLENIQDTQCGFKGFRKKHAKEIFSSLRINGFAFDVEVIYLAQKMKANIHLIPVHLIEDADSSVHFVRDSIKMTWQIFTLFILTRIKNILEFIRYGIVGVFNTLLNIVIFNLLMTLTGVYTGNLIILFSIISFVIVITQAFFVNALWVFKKKEHVKKTNYKKFFIVSGTVAIINLVVIHLLVNIIGAPAGISLRLWANIALVSTIIISVFGNFFGYKFIVFK